MVNRKGPLADVWLVGALEWDEKPISDTASVVVCRTKRAATRYATRKLAWAELHWAKDGDLAEQSRMNDPHRGHLTRREYAEWAARHGGVGGVRWRDWLHLQDGITLYGPRGEREHIPEPSQAARHYVWRTERQSNRQLAAMIAAMRHSKEA